MGELLRRCAAERLFSAAKFLTAAAVLYSSVVVHTLRSSIRVITGRRAIFVVTPKRKSTATKNPAAAGETWVAGIALLVAGGAAHTVAPAVVFVMCAASAWVLRPLDARDTPTGRGPRRALV